MERGCCIGIDQGSSTTKAVVVGRDGRILFRAKRELTRPFREGPRVEQDPEVILRSVREVLDEAVLQERNEGIPVLGVGFSCQRSSCLAWDEGSGEPLSPVLSWRDTRGSSFVAGLAEHKDHVISVTGLPLTPYYSASKFRWLSENIPSSRRKTAVFGALSSFLAQRLTGSPQAVIDHTNAARTQLMDIGTLAWAPDLIELFGLEDIRLPEIAPTLGAYGKMQTSAGPVPLLACIGDQQAALLGLGVTGEGECCINYGTGAFLLVSTGMILKRVPGLLSSIHYSSNGEQRYLLEGSVNAAGDALEWLRSRFGLFGGFDEVDDLCWKATENVVAFLGLNGTGAPHWETDIASAIYGLSAGSGPADIVRATVEGIVFFVQDIADAMKEASLAPTTYIASGGLSSISYLIQAQADLLGRDIVVTPLSDTSALGAAFLAGLGQGTWTPADLGRTAGRGEPVSPRTNTGLLRRRRRWKALHEAVRALDRL